MILQPRCINWSYRNLGIVQRTHMNRNMKHTTFAIKASTPNIAAVLAGNADSSTNGMSYPPKNKVAMITLLMNMLMYSEKR